MKLIHGLRKHSLYAIWSGMKGRCYCKNNINYKNYGARGIVVCQEWQEFLPFYEWAVSNNWNKELQIDRIDNDGNYEPSNCRFVSSRINSSNKRNSSKYGVGVYKDGKKFRVQIQINGEEKSLGSYQSSEEAREVYDKALKSCMSR